MNASILHIFPLKIGTLLFVEPGTMLMIAGGVLLAALLVGFYLYSESKKESEHWLRLIVCTKHCKSVHFIVHEELFSWQHFGKSGEI